MIDDRTMHVSGATATMGKLITQINGRSFDRKSKTWTVPVAGFFQVVKAVGVQNVSIDYDVLVAQDKQLQRMVRQYRSIGVQIWLEHGEICTTIPLLTEVLRPLASLMQWLPDRPFDDQTPMTQRRSIPDVSQLALIIDGVNNAAKQEERKQAMRRNRWRRRQTKNDKS